MFTRKLGKETLTIKVTIQLFRNINRRFPTKKHTLERAQAHKKEVDDQETKKGQFSFAR